MVLSQEAAKMHIFLQFAFNAGALREYLREPWMQIYDYTFIDDKIIGGVERNLEKVAGVISVVQSLRDKNNSSNPSNSARRP